MSVYNKTSGRRRYTITQVTTNRSSRKLGKNDHETDRPGSARGVFVFLFLVAIASAIVKIVFSIK